MRGHIYFSGKDLADFGLYVSGDSVQSRPEKDYLVEEVPGRNGDIYISNKRFRNISVQYPAFVVGRQDTTGNVYQDYNTKIQDLFAWLSRPESYARLEDSYNPDFFRAAIFSHGADVTSTLLHAGEFTLQFECKPQRFAKSGEVTMTYTGATTIHNPYLFPALPMLRVYGYGTLNMGNYSLQIAQTGYSYIDIDCERQDAYFGAINCNPAIGITEFPRLDPGDSSLSFSEHISRVQITPRWWTL